MIQIEYLLDALRIDVMENKAISESHQLELLNMLDGCPTIPMSINPIKLAKKGMEVQKYLNMFETKYKEYGGDKFKICEEYIYNNISGNVSISSYIII